MESSIVYSACVAQRHCSNPTTMSMIVRMTTQCSINTGFVSGIQYKTKHLARSEHSSFHPTLQIIHASKHPSKHSETLHTYLCCVQHPNSSISFLPLEHKSTPTPTCLETTSPPRPVAATFFQAVVPHAKTLQTTQTDVFMGVYIDKLST